MEALCSVGQASFDEQDNEQGAGYGLFDGVDVLVSKTYIEHGYVWALVC
jgi:hypothetical protein